MKTVFYQIRLFKKGEIEIFQNVFTHDIHIVEGETVGITIKYSSAKNTGCCSVAERPMEDVYNLEIWSIAEFIPNEERPRDKRITLYGTGKPKHYFPYK